MKTMLWKELRENVKWAALGFVILLLAEFFVLSSQRNSSSSSTTTICDTTFLMVTALGCSLIGATLGVLQILPESRRDQWASLLHRPVPRGVIFFGKAGAGLLLCLAATALPLAGSILYVTIPGRFAAPFVPGLALPAASDLLLGPVFYAAALLACLHRGKWYGSRAAIVLAALAVLILHLTAGWPFLLPLLATGVFMVAAWGAILTNGPLHGRPVTARAAFILVVLTGSSAAVLLLCTVLQWIPWFKVQPAYEYSSFLVAKDGRVFIQTRKPDSTTTLTDPDGKPVTDERYLGDESNTFLYTYSIGWNIGQSEQPQKAYAEAHPRMATNYVSGLDRFNFGSQELWYLLAKQKYLIGYDRLSRRCVGIFDAEGFKPPGSVPKPFAEKPTFSPFAGTGRQIFWTSSQVYMLDTAERKLTPFFNAGDDPLYSAAFFPYRSTNNQGAAVALGSGIRLFNKDGSPWTSIPYHYDLAKYPDISGTATESRDLIFLEYQPAFDWGSPESVYASRIQHLDVLDARGNIIHSYGTQATNVYKTPRSWSVWISMKSRPLLPAAASAAWIASRTSKAAYLMQTPLAFFCVESSDFPSLIVIAVVLGIAAWQWGRRAGFAGGPAWRWALFVACFGLPGLMTFRMAADWPECVPCPRCHRKRVARQSHCGRCGEPWAPPAASETEIFDEAAIVANRP